MKKTFPLKATDRADARVIEAIKHDVRKYVKRERKKPLPVDFEIWDFACRVGVDPASAESKSLGNIGAAIDATAASGSDIVYVEVLAVPARRALPADKAPPLPA